MNACAGLAVLGLALVVAWTVEPRAIPAWDDVVLENSGGLDYQPGPAMRARLTVLALVRGGWCPYSVQLLKELRAVDEAITAKGFQIIVVTPERPARVRRMLEELELPFVVVSDRANELARRLDLAPMLSGEEQKRMVEAGVELPLPLSGESASRLPRVALLVLGEDGRIYAEAVNVVAEVPFRRAELLRCCDVARSRGRLRAP